MSIINLSQKNSGQPHNISLCVRLSIIGLFIFGTTTTWAYVPSLKMILSRTAENGGRGYYEFTHEIEIYNNDRSHKIKEVWQFQDMRNFRMTIQGLGEDQDFRAVFVYKDDAKYFIDSDGVLKKTSLGSQWYEAFFLFRFSKNIYGEMQRWGMIPADWQGLNEPARPELAAKSGTKIMPKPHDENFMRLARMASGVSYEVALQPIQLLDDTVSALWIAQDEFFVSAIKLKDLWVKVEEPAQFARRFAYPKIKKLKWNHGEAKIQTHVKPIEMTQNLRNQLNPLQLKTQAANNHIQPSKQDLINEFYRRFR